MCVLTSCTWFSVDRGLFTVATDDGIDETGDSFAGWVVFLVIAHDAITMMNTLTYFDIDEKSKCGYGTEIIK